MEIMDNMVDLIDKIKDLEVPKDILVNLNDKSKIGQAKDSLLNIFEDLFKGPQYYSAYEYDIRNFEGVEEDCREKIDLAISTSDLSNVKTIRKKRTGKNYTKEQRDAHIAASKIKMNETTHLICELDNCRGDQISKKMLLRLGHLIGFNFIYVVYTYPYTKSGGRSQAQKAIELGRKLLDCINSEYGTNSRIIWINIENNCEDNTLETRQELIDCPLKFVIR